MTVPGTGTAPCPVARKDNCVARIGKLDVDIGIAMGSSVARAMAGISRAIGSVAERTGKAAMGAMSSRYIRECRTAWPPAGAGRSVARSATVAGTGLGVASLAIRRRARSYRVHPCDAAIRMATACDAAGERR
jgi:hypothetical protein